MIVNVVQSGKGEEEALKVQWAAPLALHGGLRAPITSTFRRTWLEAHHPSSTLPRNLRSTQLKNSTAGVESKTAAAAATNKLLLPAVGAAWAAHSAASESTEARAIATTPLLWGDCSPTSSSNVSSRARSGQSVIGAALSYDSLVCQDDSSGLIDALGRLRRDG
jgi:hypothetical protein